MVVGNAEHVGLVDALGGLGEVGEVNEIDVLAGDVVHHFGSGEAELLQHEFAFGGGFALGSGLHVQTAFLVQVGNCNGSHDAVRIGIHMTKNKSRHTIIPPGIGFCVPLGHALAAREHFLQFWAENFLQTGLTKRPCSG